MNTPGYGEVRPSKMYNGGNVTGLVVGVSWSTWGGSTARGSGTGYYVDDGEATVSAYKVPVKIRAYGLTTCGDRPAYQSVIWWFPSKGETFQSAVEAGVQNYNLCYDR